MIKALVFLLMVESSYGRICNICDCSPSTHDTTKIAVNCVCNGNITELNLSQENLNDIEHATSFTVSGCNKVDFSQNSFAKATLMFVVIVRQINVVSFEPGVFSNLTAITLESVGELILKPKAFLGARGLANIHIRNSSITTIPEHALYDILGMARMEFTETKIGKVDRNAIKIRTNQFIMDKCQVEYIDNNGIEILALNEAKISSSTFWSLKEANITIKSERINMIGNIFHHLDSNVMNSIKIDMDMENPIKSLFKDNIIHNITEIFKFFHYFKENSYDFVFSNNTFDCSCSEDFQTLADVSSIYNSDINYCSGYCNMSIYNFLRKFVYYETMCSEWEKSQQKFCTRESKSIPLNNSNTSAVDSGQDSSDKGYHLFLSATSKVFSLHAGNKITWICLTILFLKLWI